MANPNIVSASNIKFRALAVAATDTFTNVVTCGADKSLRVSSVVVSNITATASSFSLVLSDGTATHSIASSITVPKNASLVVISRDNPVYLTEGYSIEVAANAAGAIHVTGSYEEIA